MFNGSQVDVQIGSGSCADWLIKKEERNNEENVVVTSEGRKIERPRGGDDDGWMDGEKEKRIGCGGKGI